MALLFWCCVLLVCYCCWKLLKVVKNFIKEYYTLWNIALGGLGSDAVEIAKPSRLHLYICLTEYMDEVSVNELYAFLTKMMDTEVSVTQFHSLLRTYEYAILCRERTDGSLRGTTLLGFDRKEVNGKRYTLLRVGLAFFQNYYAGGPFLYYVMALFMLKELVLHPLTPFYAIGKVFGYKSYMVLANSCTEFYPRHDCETPDFARDIMNRFGKSVKAPSEEYDEENFILKREKVQIKTGLADVSERDLKNPHIKFFVERNPKWDKGHQLVVLGRYTWTDIGRVAWKSIVRSLRPRKDPRQPKRKKMLTRLYSYQSEDLRQYSTTFSEMDMLAGEVSLHVTEEQLRTLSVSNIDDLVL